jgi:hypothetical protein
MKTATSFLTLLAMTLISFGVTGCMRGGLGDPATASIDPRLEGLWKPQDEGSDMLLMKAWDKHAYAATEMKVPTTRPSNGDDDGKIEPVIGRCYKAWLAYIGGHTYLTMETSPQDIHPRERPYVVLDLTIENSDRVIAKALDADFVGNMDSKQLEKLVKENPENPKLYVEKSTVYQRVDPLAYKQN